MAGSGVHIEIHQADDERIVHPGFADRIAGVLEDLGIIAAQDIRVAAGPGCAECRFRTHDFVLGDGVDREYVEELLHRLVGLHREESLDGPVDFSEERSVGNEAVAESIAGNDQIDSLPCLAQLNNGHATVQGVIGRLIVGLVATVPVAAEPFLHEGDEGLHLVGVGIRIDQLSVAVEGIDRRERTVGIERIPVGLGKQVSHDLVGIACQEGRPDDAVV